MSEQSLVERLKARAHTHACFGRLCSGIWISDAHKRDHDLLTEAAAALSASPSGMVVVPAEPTEAMIRAACPMVDDENPWPFVVNIYRAMLTASPAQAKEGG